MTGADKYRCFTLTNSPERQDTFLPFDVRHISGGPALLMVETFEPVSPTFVLTEETKEATYVEIVPEMRLSKRPRIARMFKPL